MRNRELRLVELAWGASIVSEWAHFVALGVFAYDAGGVTAVGIAGLARMLPAAVVAPLASSLGDRYRRERVLVATALVGACALAGSAAAFFAGGNAPLVYALAAVIGITLDALPAGDAGDPAFARPDAGRADRRQRRELDDREPRHAGRAAPRGCARVRHEPGSRLRGGGRHPARRCPAACAAACRGRDPADRRERERPRARARRRSRHPRAGTADPPPDGGAGLRARLPERPDRRGRLPRARRRRRRGRLPDRRSRARRPGRRVRRDDAPGTRSGRRARRGTRLLGTADRADRAAPLPRGGDPAARGRGRGEQRRGRGRLHAPAADRP